MSVAMHAPAMWRVRIALALLRVSQWFRDMAERVSGFAPRR